MNVLYSAKNDDFWVEVATSLLDSNGFFPVYWVGQGGERRFENCFYHDVWRAFSLQGKDDCVSLANDFDLNSVTRAQYYNYLKILDRVDFKGNFTFSERDDLFKRHMEYWLAVLKKFEVGCVIFSNAPHLPYDYPLYLCAELLGIKILMFNLTSIAGVSYLTSELGGAPISVDGDCEKDLFETLAVRPFDYANHNEPWYMKAQKNKQYSVVEVLKETPVFSLFFYAFRSFKRFIRTRDFNASVYDARKGSSFKTSEDMYGESLPSFVKLAKVKVESGRIKKTLLREYKNLSRPVEPQKQGAYLYFPLHYQPELTTTPLGGDASDQLLLIRRVAQCLPKDVSLIVKEHSSQFAKVLHGHQGRFRAYWELILRSENVILCDLDVPSIELIKHSQGVLTVTGTAGWEALVNNIPCAVFGAAWYREFPGVIRANIHNVSAAVKQIFQPSDKFDVGCAERLFSAAYFRNDVHGVLSGKVERNASSAASVIRQAWEQVNKEVQFVK